MIEPLSPRDYELLSSYLDEQLRPEEMRQLEQRLSQNEKLRAELDSLRRTRQMLRSVPLKKIPRSFTLTAEMVALRPVGIGRLFPVFRLSAIVTALLLVVTFMTRFAPVYRGAAPMVAAEQPSAMMAAEQPSAKAADEQPATMSATLETSQQAQDQSSPPIILWGGPENYAQPAYGMGGGGGSGGEPFIQSPKSLEGGPIVEFSAAPTEAAIPPEAVGKAMVFESTPTAPEMQAIPPAMAAQPEESLPEPTAAAELPLAEMVEATSAAEMPVPAAPEAAPAENAAIGPTPEPSPLSRSMQAGEDSGPILGISNQPGEEQAFSSAPSPTPTPQPAWYEGSFLAIIQVTLGLAALTFALLSFIAWRKNRL